VRADDRQRASVVDYWRVVEMFSPPGVPSVDDRKWVFRCADDEPLPWEVGHRLVGVEPDPKKVWRHVVYLGCFSMERVVEVMARVYGEDPESYDRRTDGESALAAFAIDEHGVLVDKSAVLSSCAWATGRVVGNSRTDLRSGLDIAQSAAEKLISGALGELIDFAPDGADLDECIPPVPATADDLRSVLADMTSLLGVQACLQPDEIRIKSTLVHRKHADAADDDFLNSFIVDDLGRVAGRIGQGRYGSALRAYLSGEQSGQRVDLRRHPEVSLHAARPQAVPLGRWPANPDHPLALSQQFAVNRILDPNFGETMFAVNGPPGTGKTTMLRDIVA
jgi:hypothetical protein